MPRIGIIRRNGDFTLNALKYASVKLVHFDFLSRWLKPLLYDHWVVVSGVPNSVRVGFLLTINSSKGMMKSFHPNYARKSPLFVAPPLQKRLCAHFIDFLFNKRFFLF